jgi:hypothetical protein
MEDVLENSMTPLCKWPVTLSILLAFISFVRKDSSGSDVGGGTVVDTRNMRKDRVSPYHHASLWYICIYSPDARSDSEKVSLQSIYGSRLMMGV